jgi:pimeloyl-ACP methyl ester carboxylesterase
MPAGCTLVLIPGIVNTGTVWRHQQAALAQAIPTVVAEHAQAATLPGMARSMLERFPGPLVLAGHSMGGRIALEACRLEPGRIRGVALLATGCKALAAGESGEAELRKRRALVALARQRGMRAMLQQWILDMLHPGRYADAALVEEITAMMARSSADDFERQVEALVARPDASDVLTSLDVPALVLCGREDRWADPSRHAAMARLARGSMLVVVPECGHMAPLEQPEAVNQALRDWLAPVLR